MGNRGIESIFATLPFELEFFFRTEEYAAKS